MENTKKESNAVSSKLSEEQFNKVRINPSLHYFGVLRFDGFYPTLNTELLTEIKNSGQMTKFEFLTEDEFISIIKDYGSVSHSLKVDGMMTYSPTDLSEYLDFNISAEKIEEIGVDEIKKWGAGECFLTGVEENLKSHSMMDEYPSGLENYVINDCDFNPAREGNNICNLEGVRVITNVNISLPNREELLPEKLVA